MSKQQNKPSLVEVELKPLTEEEYSQAPEAVRKVYIAALEYIPIDPEEKRQTILAHPEYFTLKKQAKKSFGEKFKRLSNLKQHRDSLVKKATCEQEKANKRSFGGKIRPERVTNVAFVPKDQVEFPPIPECDGDCGLGYCDTNGCMDRKKELFHPSELPGLGEILSYNHSGKITLQGAGSN